MTEKISKIESEKRIFSFFLKVLRYIKKNICGISKAIIIEYDLEKSDPKITIGLELSFRMASKKDIDSMDEEHYGYDQKAKQYSIDRLAKGDRCILALNNSRIIGYLWVMKDHFELAPFSYIHLPKKRVYSYKGFVLKEHRGKRIFWATHVYLFNMLRKEGKRFVVGAIDLDNKPALKLKEFENWKIIGNLIHVRFFGLKYDYIKKKALSYLQNS